MTKVSHRWYIATCSILLLISAGCSSLTNAKDAKNGKKDSTWSFFKKKEYQTPQSINVTWTYDIFTKEGKPPTRGFGGRLYFYNEKSQAIPVEGELTVFGFDDTERSHDGSSMESADKKFRFTPEQFTTHFSESELGASYSIWIPWDAAPGMQKKIMLIPTFKSKDGPVIRGNAATLVLPGVQTQGVEQQVLQASANSVERASHTQRAVSVQHSGDANNRTTTIQLPPRGYPSKPVLSPEQAADLLRQLQEAQPTPLPIPNASQLENGATSITQHTVPATQVASPLPSFHLPTSALAGSGPPPSLLNGSALPGFAQASVGQPPTHFGRNPLQAPAGPTVPSSAYQPR
jgi:hypothetical protein